MKIKFKDGVVGAVALLTEAQIHQDRTSPPKAVKLIQAENCSEVHDGDLQREISQVYVGLGL